MAKHGIATPYEAGYDDAADDDAAEFKRLDAENASLRGEVARLNAAYGMLEIVAGTLAVHVLGHFAMVSATSPAICQQWAEAVQKTIAEQSTH